MALPIALLLISDWSGCLRCSVKLLEPGDGLVLFLEVLDSKWLRSSHVALPVYGRVWGGTPHHALVFKEYTVSLLCMLQDYFPCELLLVLLLVIILLLVIGHE